MKKNITKEKIMLCLLLFISTARATTITITVQDFSFSPSGISAVVGDTIMWTWVNGTHTTTSTSVPAGATSWDHSLTSGSTSFKYKLLIAGSYSYNCTVHPTMMSGTITVTATGISSAGSTQNVALFYPNPASSVLNIKLSAPGRENELSISDVTGREVYRTLLTSVNSNVDITLWDRGIYFYVLRRDDERTQGKLVLEK